VSTPEEASRTGGPPQCHQEGDAAHALFAVIAQLGLALRESQEPVSGLGAVFARQARILTELRAASDAATAGGWVEQLQCGVFEGIQQLQFYDRLVQHLSLLQEYLIGVANELDPMKTRAQAQEVWNELYAKLRRRLISDEQRGLLDLFLSPAAATRVSAQAARPDHSPPGSLEMF